MNAHQQYACGSMIQLDGVTLRIDQDLQSDLKLIDDAVAGIVAMIRGAGCLEELDAIDLAIREAITNAIIHGNRCDQSKAVHIRVTLHKDRGLLIIIKDAGFGFDLCRMPNPLVGEGILANHGRGIFLIRQCMDDVQFRFEPETTIYMRRYKVALGKTNGGHSRSELCSRN